MEKGNKKTAYGVKHINWKYSFSASWTNTISCSNVNLKITLDFRKVSEPIERDGGVTLLSSFDIK